MGKVKTDSIALTIAARKAEQKRRDEERADSIKRLDTEEAWDGWWYRLVPRLSTPLTELVCLTRTIAILWHE